MPCRRSRTLLPLAAALVTACAGDPVTPPVPPTPPVAAVGAIRVAATTAGESAATAPYLVRLGARTESLDVNGTVRLDSVPSGAQSVTLERVPANCTVEGEPTRSVTVTAGATSDLGFTVRCSRDDTGALLAPLACPALQPAVTRGRPLQELALGRLPAQLEGPPVARVSTGPGTPTGIGMVLVDEAGDATLVVPVHPSGRMAGGEVSVRIGDATRTCAPFALQIEPVPAAPGELPAIVNRLQVLVAEQASLLGTSVAELQQAAVDTLPELLLPLAIAQGTIDHPRNPNSLRAVVDGMDAETRAVMDGLIALTGFRASLLPASPVALTSRTSSPSRLLEPAFPGTPSRRSRTAPNTASGCVGTITDASTLDQCMALATSAAFDLSSPTRQLSNDLGALFGLVGLVPNPLATVGATTVGLLLFARQVVDEGTASLLPSSFTSMRIDATPARFNEDEPGPGAWRADVTATSTGWQLDALALNTLLQAAGARQLWLDTHGATELVDDVWNAVLNVVLQEAANRIGSATGLLTIAPRPVGPVDISSSEYSEAEIATGTSVVLAGHEDYEPRDVGVTQVRVSTRTGKFGGQRIGNTTPIEVGQLRLRFTFDGNTITQRVVRSNTTYVFTLRAEESSAPHDVAIDPIPPSAGTVVLIPRGGRDTEVRYTAPDRLDALPIVLTARHTAQAGARAFNTEPRVATLMILPVALRISPAEGCVEAGKTLTFRADIAGDEQDDVTWTASAGSITRGGVYTAPSGAAPRTAVTIRAEVTNVDGTFEDTVTITLGPCRCYGTITLGAPISRSWSGIASWNRSPGLFGVSLINGGSATSNLANPERLITFNATLEGAPGEGGFELLRALFSGGQTATANWVFGLMERGDSFWDGNGLAAITTFKDGDVMEGTLNGNIKVQSEQYDRGIVVPLQFTFRALAGSQTQFDSPFFACYLESLGDDDDDDGLRVPVRTPD